MWDATEYTSRRIDKAGQALVAKDGSIAVGHQEREQAILSARFPKGPPGSYKPRERGRAFEQMGVHLVGALLGKAANLSTRRRHNLDGHHQGGLLLEYRDR